MIEHTLNIGDVITSPRKARYSCFGLGSCIGLFLQDRLTGLSGGAHILLPENEKGPDGFKFYNVIAALDEILSQFKSQGSSLTALRAKITGGASVMGININTGSRNSESIIHQLKSRRIYIAAMDLGGDQSRTARFESHTGTLTVLKSSLKECKIY
jgi:chemotaxis protein CheD